MHQYDYGARFYNPVVARWNVIGPWAENHFDVNPYNYILNNPANYIDPLGLDTFAVNNITTGNDSNARQFDPDKDVIALNAVTISGSKGSSTASTVANIAIDFIPIVGSGRDFTGG
ncbi:RHS repeat-associated core domain-containing protein [Desertivirga xinjiangensis]|uniref:RHS repeat-associated core domain-containing protein n=1 Tax=Desertivirga xinjiangensis TaxID=539206 RepID=UPI00210EEE97|nr:RHS repeat-associated core domain-containing protein [Pedobacter xinjiangensis]